MSNLLRPATTPSRVGSNCCCTWLQHSTSTNCPCCFGNHLSDFSTVRPASPLLLNLVASACVVCTECGAHVRHDAYRESRCQTQCSATSQDSPDTSIGELLNRTTSTPLTPVEVKLQSRLIKRSLASSPEDNILHIKTGGQVKIFVCRKLIFH